MQDNLQFLQLKLANREQTCRNLQDKVRDLENQLADERRTRLKQESNAFPGVSLSQSQKIITEKKPPLAPSKALRLPLRTRTSNFLPPPSPLPRPAKARKSFVPSCGKENLASSSTTTAILKPRRGSIAVVRPSPQGTKQVLQPKRRASIATLRPESNLSTFNGSAARPRNNRLGQKSFVWDTQRMWQTSRVLSPIAQEKETSVATPREATPVGSKQSSKFMGSPPSQAGSWRPKHPTVVAIKKQIVWSPLKMKAMRSRQ